MQHLTRRTWGRLGWLAGLLLAGGLLSGCVVVIDTPPMKEEARCVDLDLDGVIDESWECSGIYPVYDGNETLDFSWQPFPFAEGENGSYLVVLMQVHTDGSASALKASHHWAANPNGPRFTMGSFGYGEEVCTDCASYLLVLAETYTQVYDPATDTYEYAYSFVEGPDWLDQAAEDCLNGDEEQCEALLAWFLENPVIQISGPFFLELFRPE